MQRYFINDNLNGISDYDLGNDQTAYHHLVHVMRGKINQQIELVDHQQALYIGTISQIDQEKVTLQLEKQAQVQVELPIEVILVTSPLKTDKTDWLIQKATELGVSEIILTDFKRTVVDWGKQADKKQVRFEKIALAAAEQSHRLKVPKVTIKQNGLSDLPLADHVLVAYEESAKQGEIANLAKAVQTMKKGHRVVIIVGPEGGIDIAEVNQLVEQKAILVGLGPRILRAETAPLYVLSALSAWLELNKETK